MDFKSIANESLSPRQAGSGGATVLTDVQVVLCRKPAQLSTGTQDPLLPQSTHDIEDGEGERVHTAGLPSPDGNQAKKPLELGRTGRKEACCKPNSDRSPSPQTHPLTLPLGVSDIKALLVDSTPPPLCCSLHTLLQLFFHGGLCPCLLVQPT